MLSDSYEVYVTVEDINLGNPGESESCPIALSLRRQTGLEATVLYEYAYLYESHLETCFELPETAKAFISHFDNNEFLGKPLPVTFTMVRR
jgi:hypothetical protein